MTTVKNSHLSWKTIQFANVQRIERVVAEFYVECRYIPSRYFRVKVTEDASGNFIGRLNVAVKLPQTETPEWTVGLGSTVDNALNDAIQGFLQQIDRCGQAKDLNEENFEWAAPEDF